MLAAMRGPRRAAHETTDFARGLLNLRGLGEPGRPTSLNGPIGPHRRWDWARSRLSDIKRIRSARAASSVTAIPPSPVVMHLFA